MIDRTVGIQYKGKANAIPTISYIVINFLLLMSRVDCNDVQRFAVK